MTQLRVDSKVLPGADLGPKNPLPPLRNFKEVQKVAADPDVAEDVRHNLGYGLRPNPLPYLAQDGYSRSKSDKAVKTIVLENDYLTATFLPEYGGRLWSLYDKTEKRDLIYENPVFQPANLAIRNAWLSGGVEWNIGLRGHSPFTCSPVFAARVDCPDGTPLLRMYEYERIRQVPFHMDVLLPTDSRFLLVFVRIMNPHEEEIPMYWWSNIAYPEHPRTRVVAPAEKAYRFGYGHKGLSLKPVPVIDGVDVSYSVNLGHSADFFFDIPEPDRKWISAIDEDGTGLFQTSTDRLLGRKLFVWGTGPGGHAWQEFLSVPGKPYIEIQAGLAHTQMEHVRMPAATEWSWLEAYGHVTVDPDAVHRGSWADATSTVGDAIDRAIPRDRLEELYRAAGKYAFLPVQELLHAGSGWGHLEALYRSRHNLPPIAGAELDYRAELTAAQVQWRDLLERGSFPAPPVLDEPVGYEVQKKWRSLLQNYVEQNPDNWYAHLHLGLMQFEEGDLSGAARSWEASVAAAENPWAYRNLGALSTIQEDSAGAVEAYRHAFTLLPDCTPLAIEFGRALLTAGRPKEWLEVHDTLPHAIREQGRFQLLYAQALLESDSVEECITVLEREPEVTDLREGENSLTDIWYRAHERKLADSGSAPEGDLRDYVQEHFPPPARIDFRMKTGKQE